jgi:hypothetical protein
MSYDTALLGASGAVATGRRAMAGRAFSLGLMADLQGLGLGLGLFATLRWHPGSGLSRQAYG